MSRHAGGLQHDYTISEDALALEYEVNLEVVLFGLVDRGSIISLLSPANLQAQGSRWTILDPLVEDLLDEQPIANLTAAQIEESFNLRHQIRDLASLGPITATK